MFSFTNHTVLPEALEKWPVELVEAVGPNRDSTTDNSHVDYARHVILAFQRLAC